MCKPLDTPLIRLRTLGLRGGWLHLAVAAVLLMQSLGFQHRVLHRPQGLGFGQQAMALQAASGASGLFAGHDRDSADCRLVDQLFHADLASLPVSALPCSHGAAPAVAAPSCGHRPEVSRNYCARGPPSA